MSFLEDIAKVEEEDPRDKEIREELEIGVINPKTKEEEEYDFKALLSRDGTEVIITLRTKIGGSYQGFNDVWVSYSNEKDLKMSVEEFTDKFNVIPKGLNEADLKMMADRRVGGGAGEIPILRSTDLETPEQIKKATELFISDQKQEEIIAFSFEGTQEDGSKKIIDFKHIENPKAEALPSQLIGKVRGSDEEITYDISYDERTKMFSSLKTSEEELNKFINDKFQESNNVVKTVPQRYEFNDQPTTDMLLSGKKLSEDQQNNDFYKGNGEYSEDTEYFTLGYRKFAPAGWAFFGGMVEPNQDAWENMTEELKEEARQNLEDLTTTPLGEFHKSEVRGTCITTVFSQESNDLSTVKAGDDIEGVLFLDRKGLEHFLKNNSNLMVPHHLELLEELTALGKLPNFIREAVIANATPPITQEELLKLIKDNQEAIAAVTEVFEKTEVPVMLIKDLYTEEQLGRLDNADYTEAYKAGKWTSLQNDKNNKEDMYPIGGSEKWPTIEEIKKNPTEEFYIVKGATGEDVVMYKKQETPNLLNLSDPRVIEILGDVTELIQPANWGEGVLKVSEGGAYLCMNDKAGEVYLIQKDENGNPEHYQKLPKTATSGKRQKSGYSKD